VSWQQHGVQLPDSFLASRSMSGLPGMHFMHWICHIKQIKACSEACCQAGMDGTPTGELAAAQFATGFEQLLLGLEMNERFA
jgi:hypothetical protein